MESQLRANPECVNASNPYHHCTEHCAAGKPRIDSPGLAQNGNGSNTKRRTERGGSGGLPLFVFLQNGSAEDSKVDPRCANASNPYHVCTDYCMSKLNGADRAKVPRSPVSLFSRRSLSSSSGEDNSVKVRADRKVDPRCANATNPYHICAEYCFNKLRAIDQAGRSTPVANGMNTRKSRSNMMDKAEGSTSEENSVKMGENRKVDPRCKNASNPYHHCTVNCLNGSSQMERVNGEQPVSTARESNGKLNTVEKRYVDPNETARESNGKLDTVEKRYVDPNCKNASNPYHKCSENCSARSRNQLAN